MHTHGHDLHREGDMEKLLYQACTQKQQDRRTNRATGGDGKDRDDGIDDGDAGDGGAIDDCR